MRRTVSTMLAAVVACAAVWLAVGIGGAGQAAQPQRQGGSSQPGAGRGGVASSLFTATDSNRDGAVTREELKATFDRWFTEWDSAKGGTLTREQLLTGLSAVMPPPPAPAVGAGGRGAAQNQTPNPADVQAMVAALPDRAPAMPKQARKVLVIGRAAGFVHSSIPIAARTVEELGKKTGAWSTTTTYDAADITEQNLKQYDAIVLVSTTGHFLDDPNDPGATAARRKAFLDFVRGGKGVVGIHAASDAYHESASASAGRQGRAGTPAGPGRGGGGRGGAAGTLATQLLAQGDKDKDQKLTRAEMGGLADAWFDTIDPSKTGRVSQQDFPQRFAAVLPAPAPPALGPTGFPIQARATELGPDDQVGTWPEFNKMIGGMFKFHWNDGQVIMVKVDEPNHPLNAMFKGRPQFRIVDETYTFGRNVYSRENLRVLKSVDYDKMTAEDKAKEQYPRTDGDYALSWVRREGKGRVFYEAHGHNEKVYAIRPFLEHVLAGIQYALGDLPAEDSPSRKPGAK